MTDATHAYITVKPCGCVVEICVDTESQARAIASMARYAAKRRYILQRITIDEARSAASRLTGAYARCEHDKVNS